MGNTIAIAATGTITLGSALPALTKNVTITGPTSGTGVIVDGGCTVNGSGVCTGGGVTVFMVNSGVTATISALTIQHGTGGINNSGTLTLTNSTLTANSATGGGILNEGGTLFVTNSTITANSAHDGGGIRTNGGTVTVTNSTLAGNTATSTGGGIYNSAAR